LIHGLATVATLVSPEAGFDLVNAGVVKDGHVVPE
jgi:hypothetical protein